MKQRDVFFIVCCAVFVGLFAVVAPLREWFMTMSACKDGRSLLMAFGKFGVLATLGEIIGLRIVNGHYHRRGFGLATRAIVWGLLGVTISLAITIFAAGTPALLSGLGVDTSHGACFGIRLFVAFCISVTMNSAFAPVFMTVHKLTDLHILASGGYIKRFFTQPINLSQLFSQINWNTQWNFVFKKTIPLFWIPAHTVTFMLPSEFRVLFSALLSVLLGIILSVAAKK